MKNNKKIYIAAIAASITLIGCGSSNKEEDVKNENVTNDWNEGSDEEHAEACAWFNMVGKEAATTLLLMEAGESKAPKIRELVTIMTEEC